MVAPSLVMITSPLAVEIILSMPLGPKLVRIASATDWAAEMFAIRTSSFRLLSTKVSVFDEKARGAESTAAGAAIVESENRRVEKNPRLQRETERERDREGDRRVRSSISGRVPNDH